MRAASLIPLSSPRHGAVRYRRNNGAGLVKRSCSTNVFSASFVQLVSGLEMKMDLRLKEENWVALAACVTLAVSGLIKARRSWAKINIREIDDGYREPDNKQNWRY